MRLDIPAPDRPIVRPGVASRARRRLMKLEVEVCLPREAETVRLVRGVVRGALVQFGVSATCTDDIQLALSEACNNVVDHAAADDEYQVAVQLDGDQCSIIVKNVGGGFDAASLAGVMPDPSSARGRGVAIMRAVMDRVEFRSEPEDGDIVHLVKTLELTPDGPLERLG